MLWQADERSLAEAFNFGELEVEGNLEAAIPLADYLSHHTMTWTNRLRLSVNLLSSSAKHSSKAHSLVARVTGSSHSLHRDKQAIAHHHDHPAEFDAPGWINGWCIHLPIFPPPMTLMPRRYDSSTISAERSVSDPANECWTWDAAGEH